jgi:uncharacterized Zn finger protein
VSDWWYNDGYEDDDFSNDDDYTLSDYLTAEDAVVIIGPVRAVSRRGDIGKEWWGRQWVQALENMGLDGRLQRGKRYARNGSVKMLEISDGMVYASVQGSRHTPYRTALYLKPFADEEWQRAIQTLSEQAIYVAKLLAGEMPGDIEGVFQQAGLSLFPRSQRDIDFVCSCPDWGDPCKHAAAVYYLMAEQLDNDPFLLFHVRGRKRDELLRALQQYDVSDDSADSAEAHVQALTAHDIWQDSLTPLVREQPAQMNDPLALRQLGDPPGLNRDDLRKLYRTISDEARLWLGF